MDWSFSYGGSIITVNQNPCVLIPHVSYTDAMPMNSTKACETIICGSGMRPGDIVTVSNGKTMEVLLQAYKLTKQGESFKEMGWRQVTFDARGGKMLSTMTMETNSITSTNVEVPMASGESLLFKRAITVTALGTLFDAASDCQAYLRQWLPASLVRLAAPLLQPYNEGSISVSMLLHQTSFCIVSSHLTSKQKKGDELCRNSDVMEILKKSFPRVHIFLYH